MFNGITDYINCGNVINGFKKLSICFWFRNDGYTKYTHPQQEKILGQTEKRYPPINHPFSIYYSRESLGFLGRIHSNTGDETNQDEDEEDAPKKKKKSKKMKNPYVTVNMRINPNPCLKKGVWKHFAHTYNGRLFRTYIDGKVVRTKNIDNEEGMCYVGNDEDLMLGKLYSFPGQLITTYFKGSLSDLRIYKRDIGSEAVKSLFESSEEEEDTEESSSEDDDEDEESSEKERFMNELEKLREETKLLKITYDSKIEELRKKNEEHEEHRILNEGLRKKMIVKYEELMVKYDSQKQQIDELQKTTQSQKRQIENVQRNYEEHYELYHRMKYSLKSSITPQMLKKREQVNYCFEKDSFHFRFDFSIQSGPGVDEQKGTIDFEGFKLFLNGEPFSRLKICDNSIEFEMSFTKIGRNELTCIFQNIKKTFLIDVENASLCTDRCELLFYRADLEPTGDLTKSSQETEKFSSSDNIQFILKLVNENGVPLLPKYLEEEYLDIKMIKIDGGKRKMIRGVLSRSHEIAIDEVDLKGEFCVCSIEEKKLEKGSYEVKIDGDKVGAKKVFSIE